jgi:Flp pilus assembly pilin Flp
MTARRSITRQKRRPGGAWPRHWWRDRQGATAVEFAFIIPVVLLVFAGIIQLGSIFFLQNHMTNVAREAARRYVVGELDESAAETWADGELPNWGVTYTVDLTPPDPGDPADRDVLMTISVPMSDAAMVDILGLFQTGTLQASVTMREE